MNLLGVLLLLLNWIFYQDEFNLLIFSVVSICVVLVIYNFWLITNYLFRIRNYISDNPKSRNQFFRLFIISSVIFIIVFKFKWFSELPVFIGIDIFLLIVYILAVCNYAPLVKILNFFRKMSHDSVKSILPINSYSVYKIYILSLLLLITILPPMIFYSIAFKTESTLSFIYKNIDIDSNIKSWKNDKRAQFISENKKRFESNIEDLDDFIDEMKVDSIIYLFFNNSKSFISDSSDSIVGDAAFDPIPINQIVPDWYADLRFPFNRYGELTNALIGTDSIDLDLFKESKSDHFVLKNDLFDVHTEYDKSILSPSFVKNTPWFFLFIVMILCIFFILNFTVNKIYGLDFLVYAKTMVFESKLDGFLNQLISVYTKVGERRKSVGQQLVDQSLNKRGVLSQGLDTYNNILITGVNASHISHVYYSFKSRFTDRFFIMDMLLIKDFCENISESRYKRDYMIFPEVNYQIDLKVLFNVSEEELLPLIKAIYEKPDSETVSKFPQLIVFIKHFEFSYESIELNKIRLSIIRRLVANSAIRVIICSEMSLMKIHDYYEDQLIKFKLDFKKDSSDYIEKQRMIDDITNDYRMWLQLFGSFYNITIPLELTESDGDEGKTGFPFLKSELKHGTYLRKINLRYQKNLEYTDQSKQFTFGDIHDEELILNIQEIAYPYYFSVWNSLSKQEQYIVYDIATDGFVNPNNVNGILELLHKGILVYDDSLRLMNASFTNFVLTKVDNDLALKNELA